MKEWFKLWLKFQLFLLTLSIAVGVCLGFYTYIHLGQEQATQFIETLKQ